MEFISKQLDDYVVAHSENEPEILAELNRKTHLEVIQARMLSGHYQGRVLSMLSHMIKPKNVLEIGTYTGYSALCLAEGMQKEGSLITIDVNEELNDIVQEYITKSNEDKRVKPMIGDAMQIIPTLNMHFDLIFIDADKKNYLNYFNLVFDKLNAGGYIIADNVLWSGKVLEEVDETDRETKILMDFNKAMHDNPNVAEVLLPIRDGLMIIRKK